MSDQDVMGRVIAATDEIKKLLGQPPTSRDDRQFFAMLECFDREREAKAAILARAIALSVKAIAFSPEPVLKQCTGRWTTVAAPNEQWLQLKGWCLSFGDWLVARPTAGVSAGRELFLLEDGRLAELIVAAQGEQVVITDAELIDPVRALAQWDFGMLLNMIDIKLGDSPGPEAAAAKQQLRALVSRASEIVASATPQLEAALVAGR